MNIKFQSFILLTVALVVAMHSSFAVAADPTEADFIAVLQSDAPKAEKAITCKRLAVYGTKEAVPALAALLEDEELISWARIALEAIPGPEADAALRDALGKVQGRSLIGVINSLAVRRDAQAVEPVAALMADADPQVASSAAAALGSIGGGPATEILSKALPDAPETIRGEVAEGCIRCAERLLAEGNAEQAVALYDAVLAADVPPQRILEATRGAILSKKADGIPLLVELLRSEDKKKFALGLQTSREMPGPEVTDAMMAEFKEAPSDRQGLLLIAVGDRGDERVLPAVVEAAKEGPVQVRLMALESLGSIGNASCVDVLLDIAAAETGQTADAAKAALESLPGDEIGAELVARLDKAEGTARLAVIDALGRRRIESATPGLVKAASDTDAKTREAALVALGQTVALDDLAVLLERVTSGKDSEAAAKGLKAACVRMPDGEACAQRLAAAMAGVPIAAQCTILDVLGAMGGKTALETLGAAAKSDNGEIKDAASQTLGRWMSVDAGDVLLDLAKTDPETKYQVRALRGYIRLVRQFPLPDDQRVAMCRAALAAAKRDAEKKLVLEVMERYPSIGMLRLAVEAKKTPALAGDAEKAALGIAQQIAGTVDVAELMEQLGAKPVKIEIVKAEYGAGTTVKDVTEIIRKAAGDLRLIVLPSASYNAAFGGDPAPGVVKQLKIQYQLDGEPAEATFSENAPILLK